MRKSKIKAKVARGEPALVVTLHLIDPSLYELTSLMGFDGIWMDMEHHAYGMETAGNLMRAARVGSADIMARPAKGEFMRMGRMLEAGANGIMYPRCDNAKEAAEVVRWSKFAPLGTRGADGGNADMPYCTMPMDEYVRMANEETFIVIQLEDRDAVSQAQTIAEVEGVDFLFFGPGDFSILSGFPGDMSHPEIDRSLKLIADAAEKAGKHWGTVSSGPERTRQLLDMGAKLICHNADILMVKNGLEAIQQNFTSLGFQFDNRLAAGTSYASKV